MAWARILAYVTVAAYHIPQTKLAALAQRARQSLSGMHAHILIDASGWPAEQEHGFIALSDGARMIQIRK